jgi:hypothetical protein
VTELEAGARAVGLLHDGRRIADTRVFKQAKKALGVQSRRDGFGRDGVWYWSLLTQPSKRSTPDAFDLVAQMGERGVGTAVYGEGHS